jgi:transcriptional regulator with XRE-family HTH domain
MDTDFKTKAKRPGVVLRDLRVRLGMTTRQVDVMSRSIATSKGDENYIVSHARLVQIENGESTPSVFKLFSMSAIYGCSIIALMGLYVEVAEVGKQHLAMQHQSTHLLEFDTVEAEQKITFPVRFDPGFNPQKSELISRLVEVWGEVPLGLLQMMNLRRGRWGLIGLADYTMHPLLRPGSLVQIDDNSKPSAAIPYRSEYDRPLYFIELRDGYLCSWCEFRKGSILALSHPLSPVRSREFAFPGEAEIVGRVTAIAARIVPQSHGEETQGPVMLQNPPRAFGATTAG